MSKPTVRADEAVTVAVGVPSDQREIHTKRILRVLEQTGYTAVELSPDDIVQQGAHVLKVRAQIEAASILGGDGGS
jgi:hypothetical protein